MMDWDALYEACMSCQKCGLAETRHNVVFGEGPRDAEVMFIGEGPGEQEDLTGRPFVGRAGQFLDDMLAMIDLKRDKVFIGNMVKCRPPQNRDPLNTEREACFPFLRRQMAQDHRVPGAHRRHEADPGGLQDHPGARPVAGEGRGVDDGHVPPLRPAAGSPQAAGEL
mgnify:CR=1 FL=1